MTENPILLYLHIPKTGGTTLSACIYNHWHAAGEYYVGEEGYLHSGIYYFPIGFFKDPGLAIPQSVLHGLGRPDLRAVLGHFRFGLHEYVSRPCTYITVLRDPVERVWSLYHHVCGRDSDVNPVEFATNPPYIEVDNDQTRRISGLEPRLGHCTRATLERAMDNLRRHFSVVGITERFDESLILLKRVFGWQGGLGYYPKNQTRGKRGTTSLTREAVDAIRARNALDIELYDFANELLDEAIASQGASFRDELAGFTAWKDAWHRELAEKWEAQRAANRIAAGTT